MRVMQESAERTGRLLSADEVGRRLGVDTSTVYRMAGDGRLSAVKVGRQWRFPAASIPVGIPSSPIDPRTAEAVASVAASLLGTMVVVIDLDGRPLTRVHNACERYLSASVEQADQCMSEWREFADDHDLVPRFRLGALGFECAGAFIRSGDRLVGVVLAGGIAPVDAPAPDVHVLTSEQRNLVVESLPRIAAAVTEGRTP